MQPRKNADINFNEKEPTRSKTFLQYIPGITDRIDKLLKKHHIKTIYKPIRKLQHSLRSARDARDQKHFVKFTEFLVAVKTYIDTKKSVEQD